MISRCALDKATSSTFWETFMANFCENQSLYCTNEASIPKAAVHFKTCPQQAAQVLARRYQENVEKIIGFVFGACLGLAVTIAVLYILQARLFYELGMHPEHGT